MSNTIDNKVVEMQFDNAQFEKNVQTSMGTIDKLKKSLDFSGCEKGLNNLGKSSKSVTLEGIGSAVDKLSERFSTMGIIGMTALQNITNSAINAGKQMVAALTIDPMKSGLQEYETQMNAIQTIMANVKSKGSTLDDVKKALNDLNTYSDKTIYNFTEMTKNIGTFTAAGVDLKTSVASIKGIANLAAVSGSNSQQASTAMYQLSQAIASGTVKAMDWNSVVNAEMGGETFQNALKRTAKAHGVAVDAMIKKDGSFKESLKEGWISTGILTETLNQLSGAYTKANKQELINQGYSEKDADAIIELGDTAFHAAQDIKTFTQLIGTLKEAIGSGWAQSWSYIFGDFDEAKKTWTEIGTVFGTIISNISNARNLMLSEWDKLGGREDLIKTFINLFDTLATVIGPIKEAWQSVFPATTGKNLKNITGALSSFTKSMILTEDQQSMLKGAFTGLFSVLKGGIKVVKTIGGLLFQVAKTLSPLGELALNAAGKVGLLVSSFAKWVSSTGVLQAAAKDVADGIQFVVGKIEALVNFIENNTVIQSSANEFIATITNFKKSVSSFKMGNLSGISNLFSLFKSAGVVSSGAKVISSAFGEISNAVFHFGKKSGGSTDTLVDVLDQYVGSSNKVEEKVLTMKKSTSGITEFLTAFKEKVSKITAGIVVVFKKFDFQKVVDVAKVLIALKVLLSISSAIKSISKVMLSISNVIDGVSKVLGAFSKKLKAEAFREATEGIKNIAISVAILSGSLIALSMVPTDKLIKGSVALLAVSAALTTLYLVINKISGAGGVDGITSIKKGIIDAIQGFAKAHQILALAAAAFIFVAALGKMISVLQQFDDLQLTDAAKAFGKMAIAMGLLAGTMALIGLAVKKAGGGMLGTAAAMLALVIVLKEMVGVLQQYDQLPLKNTRKTIATIATVMGIFAASISILGLSVKKSLGGMLGSVAVMLSFVVVLKKMFDVIKEYNSLDLKKCAKGLLTIGILIGELTASLAILGVMTKKSLTGMLGSVAVIFSMVAALQKLQGIMSYYAGMKWDEIKKGLAVITTFIAVMTASVAVISKTGKASTLLGLTTTILALGGAIAILALLPAGKILTASTALVGVVASLALVFSQAKGLTGSEGAMKAMSLVLLSITGSLAVLTLLDTNKMLTSAVGLGAVVAALSLAFSALKNSKGAWASVLSMSVAIGAIAASLYVLSGQSSEGIRNATLAMSGVIGLMSIAMGASKFAKGSELAILSMSIVVVAIGGILTILSGMPTDNVLKVANSLSEIMLALSVSMGIISLVPVSGAATGIAGMAIVVAGMTGIIIALGALSKIDGFNWLIGNGTTVLGQIGNAIGEFAGNIVSGFSTSVSDSFPKIADNLSSFMTKLSPFIIGAKELDDSIFTGVAALARAILLITATDVIQGISSFITGGNSMSKFADELIAFGPKFKTYADSISGLDSKTMEESATAAKSIAEFATTIPNSGGMLSKLVGDNTLSSFADELVKFGPNLMAYATSVTGLKAEVVTNSINAASSIAAFAKTIPNSGGMLSTLVGDNTLSSFADELVKFGPNLMAYAKSVTGLDAEVVTNSINAASVISTFATKIPSVGGIKDLVSGDSSLSTFGLELSKFGPRLKSYADSVFGLNVTQLTAMSGAITSIIDMVKNMSGIDITSVSSFSGAVDILSKTGFSGLVTAISNTETQILSKYNDFYLCGTKLVLGISDGITTKTSFISSAVKNLVTATVNAMNGLKNSFYISGQNMIVGFINGISSKSAAAKMAASSIGSMSLAAFNKALDERSPSKETEKSGVHFINGFVNGINSIKGKAITGVSTIGSSLVESFNVSLGEHSDSKITNLSGQHFIGKDGGGFIGGVSSMSGKAISTVKDVGTKVVSAMSDTLTSGSSTISHNYGNTFKNLLGTAQSGSDAVNSVTEKAGNTEDQQIAARKTAHTLRTIEETDYWAKLLQIRQNGVDASKYKGMSLAEFEKGILSQTIEIWQKYTDTLNQNTDALMGQSNLFSAVEQKEAVSSSSLVKNLQDQVTEYAQYNNVITSLNQRITDDGLKQAINKMGIDSLAELQALNGMTDQQLTQYAGLYDQKYALARNAASMQMGSIRTDTESQLSQLYGGVSVNLDSFAKNFDGSMNSITGYVKTSMAQAALAKDSGNQIVAGFATGISENSSMAQTAAQNMITETEMAAREEAEIASPSKLFKREVGNYITEGVAQGIVEKRLAPIGAIYATILATVAEANSCRAMFVQAGRNASSGYTEGIQSKIAEVAAAAAAMANAAYEAAQKAIKSHSPSKKFIELGQYADEGMAIGFDNMSDYVADASASVGRNAIESMKNAIKKVSSVVNSSMDTQPTIRPVIDLTDVMNGAKEIDATLSKKAAISISSVNAAQEESKAIQNGNSTTATPKTFSFVQNNYSPKELSRLEIYRQTSNQFSRFREALND